MNPVPAQPVTIRLGPGVDISARVQSSDGDAITLVLTVPDRIAASDAVVEYLTPTGIHRVEGRVESETEESVRLRPSRSSVEQRRAWARADAAVPVVVSDPDTGVTHTTTLNVSGGGALIHDPIGMQPGSRVELELRLNGASIRATAQVAREVGDARGVEIVRIAAEDREQLVRFVRERERWALRVRRDA